MFHFLGTRRHFRLATAVNYHCTLRAQAPCRAHGVHRRIATADNNHVLATIDRGIGKFVVRPHQVHTRQVFIGRQHAVGILTGDIHETGSSCPRSHIEPLEAFALQVLDVLRHADNEIGNEFHAHPLQVVDFNIHNVVWQTEFRDTVFQYATNLMQCLEHRHIISTLHHVPRKRESRWTRTDDGYLDAVRGSDFRHAHLSRFPFIIGSETLQITNGDRRLLHFLQVEALRFALLLLRAHTTTHGRQRACLFQHGCRLQYLSPFDILDKARDVNAHRATFHAGRMGAVLATAGFPHRHFLRQPEVHFQALALDALFRTAFRHYHTLNFRPLFRLHGFAQGFPPIGIAVACHILVRMHELFHLFRLVFLEPAQPGNDFIKINLVGVKFRTVHTRETGLPAHRHTASAAHSRAVHHQGIQAGNSRYVILPGQLLAELHHNGRTYRHTQIYFLPLDDFFHACRYHPFLSIAAVVRHDNHFVRSCPDFVLKNNQVFRTGCQDAHYAVPGFFECPYNRQQRGNAYTAPTRQYSPDLADFSRFAQWSYQIGNIIPFVQIAELRGGHSHFLDNKRNRSLFFIRV